MEVEKLKQEVLVDLRSVIQSCKGGIPLSLLQNDYKSLIGRTIPFASLGFNSLESFLRSIPQVVRLKNNSEGQLIAEAVADSSTAHLQKLISKQKDNTKSKKRSVKSYGWRPARRLKTSSSNVLPGKSVSSNSTGGSTSASSSHRLNEVSIEKDKEIQSLKSKLATEKKMNIELKARVNQLIAQNEPHLEYENMQIMIQRIKYQIGLLQKRVLLHYSASSEALRINHSINDIVRRIEDLDASVEDLSSKSASVSSPGIVSNSSKDSSPGIAANSANVSSPDIVTNLIKVTSLGVPKDAPQVPKCDPFKLYEQQSKETEELKKQLQAQNSQMQNIERRFQSQLQKLQNQIKNNPPPCPSKEHSESELIEDMKNQIQEQNFQIQNVEKNMSLELSKLTARVEKEYFVHLVCESEKLKEFEKELKSQKSQLQSVQSKTQSQIQKLKNEVDKIKIVNIIDTIVKHLVINGMINIPHVLSASGNLPTQKAQRPQSSSTTSSTKSKKKKKTVENGATISAVMRDTK